MTFIPPTKENGFILTSNRDERIHRKAMAPRIIENEGIKLCFPMDSIGGGSWIAANGEGRISCLLNGGIEPHQKQPIHTYSRGKVLLDFVSSKNVQEFFEGSDLTSVEPFTIINIEHKKGSINLFTESIWDGSRKHIRKLDQQQPYIWSSVTLYKEEQLVLRKEWFNKFIQTYYPRFTPEKVLAFHSGTHTDDKATNVLMQREDDLKTVSITQITPHNDKLFMKYSDLLEQSEHEIVI